MRGFGIRSAISVVVCLAALVFPAAAHADESQGSRVVNVVNVVSNGQVCGLTQIDYTSTNGPAKLALEVAKSVATEVSTSVGVDIKVINAGVGSK